MTLRFTGDASEKGNKKYRRIDLLHHRVRTESIQVPGEDTARDVMLIFTPENVWLIKGMF